MIPDFDIMTTATLRPELLKKTYDSHIKNLFKEHIKKARLVINIDCAGCPKKRIDKGLNEIFKIIGDIPFKKTTVRVSYKPSFSKAFYWCLHNLKNDLTFILEDDWQLNRKTDFEKMVSLVQEDLLLVHLRISHFWSNKEGRMKCWNKFIEYNGEYFEVPQNLRGTIGFAGHPSLNKTFFLNYWKDRINPNSNPEKQIKGNDPTLQGSKFGVFHPQYNTKPAEVDLGRKWMVENQIKKKGIKAFFTEWETNNDNDCL